MFGHTLKLTCQRTFLDVDDEEQMLTSQRRSRSEPPDARNTEQTYASGLASRADQLHLWLRKRQPGYVKYAEEKHASAEASAEEVSTEADTRDNADSPCISSKNSSASAAEVEISQGSFGHPEVCHRPCVNFARGCCVAGSACDYCHLSHVETPVVTANKEVRSILQQASEFDSLAPATKHAWARAVDKGFLDAAEEVLLMLKTRLHQLDNLQSLTQKQQGKLDRFMAKMPFSGLIGLALRKCEDGCHAEQLKAGVDGLRSSLSMAN